MRGFYPIIFQKIYFQNIRQRLYLSELENPNQYCHSENNLMINIKDITVKYFKIKKYTTIYEFTLPEEK